MTCEIAASKTLLTNSADFWVNRLSSPWAEIFKSWVKPALARPLAEGV
jgi:hypothetical protein